MDELVPGANQPGVAQVWSHDWHSYEDYLTVHTSYMDAMQERGMVLKDRLSRLEIADDDGERYDTAHGFDRLHCHRALSDGTEWVEPIELAQLPTLTGFIEEALSLANVATTGMPKRPDEF